VFGDFISKFQWRAAGVWDVGSVAQSVKWSCGQAKVEAYPGPHSLPGADSTSSPVRIININDPEHSLFTNRSGWMLHPDNLVKRDLKPAPKGQASHAGQRTLSGMETPRSSTVNSYHEGAAGSPRPRGL